jgi:hypothetical protein
VLCLVSVFLVVSEVSRDLKLSQGCGQPFSQDFAYCGANGRMSVCLAAWMWHDQGNLSLTRHIWSSPDRSDSMRAGRLGRLAGLVLALAAVVVVSTVGSGGFTTMDWDWGAVWTVPGVDGGSGAGAGSIFGL